MAEHVRVELALPGRHLGDRLGRIPARLVGPVGRDGVVDITHRAHARQLRQRRAGGPVGVAPAVHALMVVQADVHRGFTGVAGFLQHLPAAQGVGADDAELGIRQLARLVQDLQRYRRLAQVMQQAGQARRPAGVIVLAHLLGQRHHQRADRHRVHVGVVVLGLQPGQADQCAGVAEHRLGDVVNQWQAALGLQRAAQAGLGEHRAHGSPRALAQLGRMAQFFGHRGVRRAGTWARGGCRRRIRRAGQGGHC